MNVDLSKVEEKRYEHFKEGDGAAVLRIFESNDLIVLKGYLEKKSCVGRHSHPDSNETIYVFGGEGKVLDGDSEYPVSAGSVSFCPKGGSHSLVNTGDSPLYFMGIVSKNL